MDSYAGPILIRHLHKYDADLMGSKARRDVADRFFETVHRRVDPTMIGFGFTARDMGIAQHSEAGFLYEHDPADFARRFPKLKDDFGCDVAPCIDIWLTLDIRSMELSEQLGDLFDLPGWLRASGRAAQADLIWNASADMEERMNAVAEALAAYFTEQPQWMSANAPRT